MTDHTDMAAANNTRTNANSHTDACATDVCATDACAATDTLAVIDAGRWAYVPALAVQRQLHQQVVDRQRSATLLLLEHDPVITVSRRAKAPQHLLADAATLQRLGIDVQSTDRGGDVTYHGPGQLVAYPIIRLSEHQLNVGRYLRLLEQVVIDTAAAFGLAAQRVDQATGVWTTHQDPARRAKLCAMGVRVSRNVSMHGLAVNVSTQLDHFDTIVPCGLPNRNVTSFEKELGDHAPTMVQVKDELTRRLASALGRRPIVDEHRPDQGGQQPDDCRSRDDGGLEPHG